MAGGVPRQFGAYTTKDGALYVIVTSWPEKELVLPVGSLPDEATVTLLGCGEPLPWTQDGDRVRIARLMRSEAIPGCKLIRSGCCVGGPTVQKHTRTRLRPEKDRTEAPSRSIYHVLINDGPATTATLDITAFRYTGGTDTIAQAPLPLGAPIRLEADSGRWLRFEK